MIIAVTIVKGIGIIASITGVVTITIHIVKELLFKRKENAIQERMMSNALNTL